MPPPPPPPPPSGTPRAMLVMAPTEARRLLRRGLRQRRLRVEVFDEPFAATECFASQIFDLVVVSLAGFGPGDEAFFRALGRRSPSTLLVALVGPDGHDACREALRNGAHVLLPEPQDDDDVAVLLRAVDRLQPREGRDVAAHFARLAVELAHVFGNRLQALQSLPDEPPLPPPYARRVEEASAELMAGIGRLRRFQDVDPRGPQRLDLADIAREALDRLVQRGVLASHEFRRRGRSRVFGDRRSLVLAVEAAADALVGLTGTPEPPSIEAFVGPRRQDCEPLLSGPPLRPALLQVRLRIPGSTVRKAQVEACFQQVLRRNDETRATHWGLAIPRLLVHRELGLLHVRQGARGAAARLCFLRA